MNTQRIAVAGSAGGETGAEVDAPPPQTGSIEQTGERNG